MLFRSVTIGKSEVFRQLSYMNLGSFWEIKQGKFIGIGPKVRHVRPERVVTRHAKTPSAYKNGMRHPKLMGNLNRPAKKHVHDYAEWEVAILLSNKFRNEFSEREFERQGSLNEAKDERVRKSIGVLSVGRKAMV